MELQLSGVYAKGNVLSRDSCNPYKEATKKEVKQNQLLNKISTGMYKYREIIEFVDINSVPPFPTFSRSISEEILCNVQIQ